MEKAQDLSNSTTNLDNKANFREFAAKLVYGLLTLAILWASGDASGEIFWSRLPLFFGVSATSVIAWMFFTHPTLFKTFLSAPKIHEFRKASIYTVAALVAGAVVSVLLVNIFNESPWVSWDFLRSFNVFPFVHSLVFIALSAYVVEFYLRGYLTTSWGRGNVIFLETVTIAVALQHFLPLVLLVPMSYFMDYLAPKEGVKVAALVRAFWTLGIAIVLSLLA